MRWTDLPAASPVRDLDWWHADERARGRIARPTLDAAVASARAAGTAGAVPRALIDAAAFAQALRHVGASRHERGGLLGGIPVSARGPDGPILLVYVTAAIAGIADEASPLSLRLESSVWTRAQATLAAGEAVVGWFHSHPGIGAFFSDTDRATQAAFFRQAYSLGWVVDPLRDEHAWFVGPHAVPLPRAAIVSAAARAVPRPPR